MTMMVARVLAPASWGESVARETPDSVYVVAMATAALEALLVSSSNLISIAGAWAASNSGSN